MKIKFIAIFLASFLATKLFAQCNDNFNLGNDTSICSTGFVNLSIPNIYDSYTWQDNSTLNTFQVNGPGTYYCVTEIASNTNLVTNGDFELGNNMFTTDYTYYPIADVNGPQGSYGVINNSNTWFNPFSPCTDHTSGFGLMMVIDGSASNGGNDAIWCQSIPVQAGFNYRFSYWVQSVVVSPVLANIQVRINGVAVDTELAPVNVCNWQEREVDWISPITGNIDFCLYDLELAGNGNDFAIDDISLVQVCDYTDTIVVSQSPIDTNMVIEEICPGDSLFLDGAWQTLPDVYYDVVVGSVCNEILETTLIWSVVDTNGLVLEICPSDSLFLEGDWQTNPGVYYDFVSGNPCQEVLATTLVWSTVDTSNVTMEICPSDSLFLEGDWQTNPGIYYDFVSGNPCQEVLVTTLIWSALDTTRIVEEICETDSFFVAGQWEQNAGVYYETIPGLNCEGVLETTLIVNALPVANAGNDVTVSYEQIVNLSAINSMAGETFFWSGSNNFSSTDQDINVEVLSQIQSYYLSVESNGCFNMDTVLIFGIPLNLEIRIPNAFTPNLDGTNDVFRLVNPDEFQLINIKIYDRWGQLIFSEEGSNPSWKGEYFNGKKCPIGTYTFFIEAAPFGNIEKMSSSGNLTLIR